MIRKSNLRMEFGGVIAVLLMATTLFAAEAQADIKFSGQATGVEAKILTLDPVLLSDTGPLPESGGAKGVSLLDAEVPGILTASVLHASTVAQGDRSRSEATAADVSITIAGNTIGAEFLTARAEAICTAAGPAVNGASEVLNLVVNGLPVTVGTGPNFVIDLPGGGKIIVNEQSSKIADGKGEITVTALHVIVPGVADVAVARAHADVQCGGGPPDCAPTRDFMTGGGWIVGTPTGSRATFGVGGGLKNEELWGHLSYIDHGAKMKVKGIAVTKYVITGPQSRQIWGDCEIDGVPGHTYIIDVTDNDEPGKDMDTFQIKLSNGYQAGGKLAGGNLQLHTPCR